MRLDISVKQEHTEIATAVAWSPDCQLLSVSDDKLVCKWGADGENLGKISSINIYATALEWFPAVGKQSPDMFAVSCVDGTFRFMSRSGREEKKVDAHSGAVIILRWSHDGTTLLTAGEDGEVKTWSKTGNLRSCLASVGQTVYCACWGPDNDQVLFGNGKTLMIKTSQSNKKNLQWDAHDETVLCADWNPSNGLIISGGEDCTYKVWDAFGRQLYSSRPLEHVVTSMRWSPNGEFFAVGSFNLLRLCDKSGWTHCRERVQCGSLLDVAWTPDGTQFACASGSGSVLFAQVMDRRLEWKHWEVVVTGPRRLRVQDVANESVEDLEYSRDRVVEMGLGCDHLVVATTSQCFVYNLQSLNTPIIFDIKAPPQFVHMCSRTFMLSDQIAGLQVVSFEGKLLSSPKCPGLRPELLTRDLVALSPDVVAVIDSVDAKGVHIVDATTGRVTGKLLHSCEIAGVYLNQHSAGSYERLLAFVDRNRDLFVASLTAKNPTAAASNALPSAYPVFKVHSHVDSCAFNDETNVLVGLTDNRLKFWYQPEVVFVDRDLLPLTTASVDAVEYGRGAQILYYCGSRVAVRKVDGSVLYTATSTDVPLLYELGRGGRWEEATRLCRHQRAPQLWAALASMSLSRRQLDTAEIALAELSEVAKVEYIQHVKLIPSEEGRHAEMALFRRQPEEAERILLQASPPLLHRAIKMNIALFRWGRALELAVKHKTHIDTVLAYRQRFLRDFQREEYDQRFSQIASTVTVSWADVLAREAEELQEERERGGLGRHARK